MFPAVNPSICPRQQYFADPLTYLFFCRSGMREGIATSHKRNPTTIACHRPERCDGLASLAKHFLGCHFHCFSRNPGVTALAYSTRRVLGNILQGMLGQSYPRFTPMSFNALQHNNLALAKSPQVACQSIPIYVRAAALENAPHKLSHFSHSSVWPGLDHTPPPTVAKINSEVSNCTCVSTPTRIGHYILKAVQKTEIKP